MDYKTSLISKAIYSRELSTPLQLAWLPDTAPSHTDINLFTNNESSQLVNSLIKLNFSPSISATFITFLATALYRYSYQSDFELQYVQQANHPADVNDPYNFLRLNFQNHTQQTAKEACLSVSDIMSSADAANNSPPFQAAFCLVELEQPLNEVLTNLRKICATYEGKIWPVIEQTTDSTILSWLYDQRIPVETIIILQSHIQQLVNQSVKKPDTPLSKYTMLTDKEIQQQIDFSKGKLYKDEDTLLYKIIEKHTQTHPDKIAVIFEQTELTYAQLNNQANKLAHNLLSRNVSNGNIIAVHITPSVNIIVSILAIHKIGAIYVPIDPGFPSTRIKAILNEINPSVILCDEQPNSIPEKFLPICHTIDNLISSSVSEDNPNKIVSVESVSHIYFTSGTTGKPKGVLSTHKNLIHYISSAINRYHFDKNDIFIAAARFTFSISMFELMVPLVAGGCVKILARETVLDLNQLCKAIATATVFHFGPSLLRQLLPYIENNYSSYKTFEKLKHVSSGGDMVPPEILEKLKSIFINAEVFVIYGSSEISCMGCTYEVSREKKINKTFVGSPHQNVQARIFDNDGNMIPIGVPGQIYFAGKGLVKGYLNLPELTKEKFILIDNERFYAIGDIGRLDQDGNIALLGREDFQVQIRGMRIELLEVEACLKSYPSITDCVVVARTLQEHEEKSLVAYLIISEHEKIIINDLNNYIVKQLPDYMIPAVFVKLDKLPTNHNAKLDRSQLPRPTSENIIVSAEFQPASNDIEQTLINIWEELFGIKDIGINHNFFELGGDSLLAVNFLIEIDNKFDKFIPISIMIDAPTIKEIAEIVSSEKPVQGIGDVVVLKKGNSEPPLFCLYGVLLYKDLAESLATERMVCGVYLQEEVSQIQKGASSEEFKEFSNVDNIVKKYLKSIKTFQPNGPYFLTGESFGGVIALEVARKLQQQGETVQLLAMFDTSAPGYQKSLSLINRISIHLRQLNQLGLPYLKQKILKYITPDSFNKNNDASNQITDIRSQARDFAIKKYSPTLYHGEVILFTAKERPAFDSGEKDLGWGKFSPNLEVHEIEGDHLEILERGQVEKLTSILLKKINKEKDYDCR